MEKDDVKLNQTMDGVVWAREFMRITGGTMDEETAIGWFCNAIMCGWDHRTWQTPEYKAQVAAALHPEQTKTEREAFIERVRHWDSIKAASVLLSQSEIAMVLDAYRAFDLVQHLHRQRAFSEKTFGPGERTKGVLEHIRKELLEIEAQPHDLTEWIDVTILALDGAWRHGATPEQIVAALVEKLAKNEAREWPDWKTRSEDEAITHVKPAAPAPAPTPAPKKTT